MSIPHEGVCQVAQDPDRFASMDVRISTVEITQRFVKALSRRFEDVPLMSAASLLCPEHNESELEGHVESRCRVPLLVKLYARKIVEGITACANQVNDTVQSALAARNFQCGARNKAEATDPCDEGKIEGFKFRVVWQVYKGGYAIGPRRTSAPFHGYFFFLVTTALRLRPFRLRPTEYVLPRGTLYLCSKVPLVPMISFISFSICRTREADMPSFLAVS